MTTFTRLRQVMAGTLATITTLALATTSVNAIAAAPVPDLSGKLVTAEADGLAGTCLRIADPTGIEILPDSGPFRAQASGLGRYLFHATDGQLLRPGNENSTAGAVTTGQGPATSDIWTVTKDGTSYSLTAGDTSITAVLRHAEGCADYEEAEINAHGQAKPLYDKAGNQLGLVDSHAHLMSEQFLGGRLHCGLPYSPLGVTAALQDCPDHSPDGWPAVSEHVLSKPGPHDTAGYPELNDWPRADSLTHEQTYYRWIERAWRGGLRLIHNYYVQNRVLCEVYPLKDEPCNEMESVRIQHERLIGLQDYIDAQAGGKGRGFLRIVRTADEAREVIAQGKVAVTLGIEISEPFGCGLSGGLATSSQGESADCTTGDIEAGLDEIDGLGIRQAILTHKFDNALGGTRYDQHALGLPVELGQVLSTQTKWDLEPCTGETRDNPVIGREHGAHGEPLCNARGLTDLGEYTVNAMIDRNMVIDIDHLSAKLSDRILEIVRERDYPGVASSHTWTDRHNYGTILSQGGAVGVIGTAAESQPGAKTRHGDIPPDFLSAWRIVRAQRDPERLFGLGIGTDMGGLAPQAGPRPSVSSGNGVPVEYPFTAADGTTTIDRQRTGNRVFDVNVDGTAHYGLLPDWVESLRIQADSTSGDGDVLVADLLRATEAHLLMWERVDGWS